MKIDLKGNELETWLYDRDNGEGAAARVINELRAQKGVNTATIQESHRAGVSEAAAVARSSMERPDTIHEEDFGEALGGKPSGAKASMITMGLSDVKDVLAPKVSEALEKNADVPLEAKPEE